MLVHTDLAGRPAPHSTAGRELLRHGYTILRGAAPASLINGVAHDLEPRFAATPFCEGGFYGERTKRFGRLLIRSPLMGELVMHKAILDLAELALGNWCERIQLNLAQAIELHPGALAQFPHRDQDMWQGSLGEVEYLVNVMWPLTKFTGSNGATLIWPRSHGLEALVEEPAEPPIVAEAEPGDAIIFLGSTLHGAGENRSIAVRKLRQRARMELDRLGEIELDPLAPIAEREFGEIEDLPAHHELSHKRRADEQAAEALCALAVKATLAKGRRGEPRFEVVRHTADQRSGCRAAQDGIALLEQLTSCG